MSRRDGAPRLARRLVRWLVPGPMGDDFLRELDAELEDQRESGASARKRKLWYWREALCPDVWRLRRAERRRAQRGRGGSAMPLPTVLSDLFSDAVSGVRSFASRPGFAVATVLTLALGLGAGAALFSVVDAVLLKPLVYARPEGLFLPMLDRSSGGGPRGGIDPYTLRRLRESRAYAELEEQFGYYVNLHGPSESEELPASRVSAGFLNIFGVPPALGRPFEDGERDVAVLSHELWQRSFGSDETIVGQSIRIEDVNPLLEVDDVDEGDGARSFTVIGVMPEGFFVPVNFSSPYWLSEIWIPLHLEQAVRWPHAGVLDVLARLAPGVTPGEASSEAATWMGRFREAEPDAYRGVDLVVVAVEKQIKGGVASSMHLLLVATGLLLAVVVTNTAHLFVTRGRLRQQEMALRRALGASRARLGRAAMVEAGMLSGAGALLAVAVSTFVFLPGLLAIMPGGIPRLGNALIDERAMAVVGGFALAVAVLHAAVASWSSSPGVAAMGDVGRGRRHQAGRGRLQSGAIGLQVALTVVLLFSTVLVAKSFRNLLSVEPGFASENRLVFDIKLPQGRYPGAQDKIRATTDIYSNIERLPVVVAAGGSDQVPPVRWRGVNRFESPMTDDPVDAGLRTVTRHYPDAIGLEILHGRSFDLSDDFDAPRVVLLDETAAEKLWPGTSALDKEIWIAGNERWGRARVVGILRSMATYAVSGERIPEVYQLHEQDPWNQQRVVVQTIGGGDPLAFAPAIREAVRDADPMLPVSNVRALDEHVARSLAGPRFLRTILGLFATASLLLSALGAFAVVSFAVATRVRETAIRMAVGATPRRIVRELFVDCARWAGLGSVFGLVGAVFAGQLLAAHVFAVNRLDPLLLAGSAALTSVVALLAVTPVARLAATTDPASALRRE